MKLTDLRSGNFNAAEWEAKGYLLPKFDMAAVAKKTYDEPTWVHFGGGNIFRAFPAAILNDALNTGKYDRGVIVAETFDYEVIDKAYAPYGNLSLAVSLCSNGTIEKKVIASVTEALKADYQFADWQRLVEIFRKPSLQMISFTITEKGYTYNEADLKGPLPSPLGGNPPRAPNLLWVRLPHCCMNALRQVSNHPPKGGQEGAPAYRPVDG